MTRLERFRLAIVNQGFTGVVCTATPYGCDLNKYFVSGYASKYIIITRVESTASTVDICPALRALTGPPPWETEVHGI